MILLARWLEVANVVEDEVVVERWRCCRKMWSQITLCITQLGVDDLLSCVIIIGVEVEDGSRSIYGGAEVKGCSVLVVDV
jgi:hypothetical protein